MYFRYPARNFRCLFCGAKMPTEQYKALEPWTCPGCSRELQFSEAQGYIVQLCFFGVALLCLYLLGLRDWQLLGAAILSSFILTMVFIGPLDRIFPRRLEPFRPPPWKVKKSAATFPALSTTIFPTLRDDAGMPKQESQSGDEPPKEPPTGSI